MVLDCEWFSLGNGCGNHKCRRDYWFADAKRLGRPWLPPCLASAKGEDSGAEEQTEGNSGKVWTEENWKRNFVRLWMAGDVSVLFEMEENTEGGWDNANRWKQEATKRTQAMWRKANNMWETDSAYIEAWYVSLWTDEKGALCHFTAGGFSWNWNPSLWAWVLLSGWTRSSQDPWWQMGFAATQAPIITPRQIHCKFRSCVGNKYCSSGAFCLHFAFWKWKTHCTFGSCVG